METAAKQMIPFSIYNPIIIFCLRFFFFFFLQKIKNLLFDEMREKLTIFFAEEDYTLVGGKRVVFSSITDKDRCICGFVIVNTGY